MANGDACTRLRCSVAVSASSYSQRRPLSEAAKSIPINSGHVRVNGGDGSVACFWSSLLLSSRCSRLRLIDVSSADEWPSRVLDHQDDYDEASRGFNQTWASDQRPGIPLHIL